MKQTAHSGADRTVRQLFQNRPQPPIAAVAPAPHVTAASAARPRPVVRHREGQSRAILRQAFTSLVIALSILAANLVPAAQAQNKARTAADVWGGRYKAQARAPKADHGKRQSVEPLHRWNTIAINATGLDHAPPAAGETRVFGEQLGPGRASRAMAIAHIAMFEALNAIVGGYQSYTGLQRATPDASKAAAVAQAAHDTLVALFPAQRVAIDNFLAEDLARIPNNRPKADGIALGRRAAASILTMRATDGSKHAEPRLGTEFITSDDPGKWRQDPIGQSPLALGAHWGEVTPFALQSPSQFRVPPPPPMNSPEYAAAYDEAKRLGGDGITTPTERTAEQTFIGVYWAYDGTPSLCAPPRLYNQITVQLADKLGTTDIELARLLALVNTAMADAGIASWESKFYYNFWRPVTAIREADEGTGPSGLGDGNPATVGDLTFTPLGAPATNLTGPNFTPPFPTYPSGHATFGGSLFQVLRRFYGTDNIPFTFVSDEYNGVTVDNLGNTRPLIPRSFQTLSQAEEENGQSRIYLGIHWSFDKTEGITLGRRIGDYVFDHAFAPLRKKK